MTESMTGGCQCGRIRYAVRIEGDDAYLCHCKMCRHATGGVSIAFRNVKKADVEWTTQVPDYFASSPIARRGFCSACGTPLTFEFPASENMDLTLGSFDDPSRFRPTHNYAAESILPAWQDGSHLKDIRTEENAGVVDRWIKAVGKLPD